MKKGLTFFLFLVISKILLAQCQIVCPSNMAVPNNAGKCGAVVTFPFPSLKNSCITPIENVIINGGFEQNYTGWKMESSVGEFTTFGILTTGQTISSGEELFDFADGRAEAQSSPALPYTGAPTEGKQLAILLQNGPGTQRLYQDITLPAGSLTLSFDLQYNNHAGVFDPLEQFFAIVLRNPATDAVLTTLYKTGDDAPSERSMTSQQIDISAYAGSTVRLDMVSITANNHYFDVLLDNVRLLGGAVVKQTAGLPSGAFFPVGTTTNTFETTDADGNKTTQSFRVTVIGKDQPLAADLELKKSANKLLMITGESVTFTTRIRNKGPLTATGIKVSDLLDTYIPTEAMKITRVKPSHGTFDTNTGIWSIGALQADKQASLVVVAQFLKAGEVITKAEVISTDQYDPDAENDRHSVTVQIADAVVISGFTLVNAGTGNNVMELKDGSVIDLASLPDVKFNIRANTAPAVVGSVAFDLTGPQIRQHTENLLPYALYGDNMNGRYYGATLQPGEYTLTGTPYCGPKQSGTKGTPLTIHFRVIYTAAVTNFTLVNADADKDIVPLKEGDVIELADHHGARLNIRANVKPRKVGSLVFDLQGPLARRHIENGPPYTLFSNLGSNYYGALLPPGSYVLTVTPCSEARGRGVVGNPQVIRFTVAYSAVVSGFTLIDAATNKELRLLQDGDKISSTNLPLAKFNIRADTYPGRVGSVVFNMVGPVTHSQTENLLPYALFGDDTRDGYNGRSLTPGIYTLTASPYSGTKGGGIKGRERSISFEVLPGLPVISPKQDKLTDAATPEAKSEYDQTGVWLFANAPNPFRTATTVSFEMEKEGQAQLTILTSQGMLVASLLNKVVPAGKHTLTWQAGSSAPGVYILVLSVGKVVKTKKMVIQQ